MRREKIEETANLVGLNASQVMQPKIKLFMNRLVFPFTQVGMLGLAAFLGFVFGIWENQKPSIYPWGVVPRSIYLAPILILGFGAGNTTLSIKQNKRKAIRTIPVIIITILITTILSFISFYLIYNYVETVTESKLGITYLYGVYDQEKN